jgi:uncharacterized protein YbjT (DUF2867 family)
MASEAPMQVAIFGASGMVGQGVLRECLRDPGVTCVLAVGRAPLGASDPRVRELVVPDLRDLSGVERELAACDACFFCLGVSSTGLDEARYTELTHDLTLAVARTLARVRPGMAFTYVSGAGTDASEHGRVMWARVKGRTENALRALPLAATMFRPGIIVPMHGERSKTPQYQAFYSLLGGLLRLARPILPGSMVTTTEQMGRAMLAAARGRAGKPVLESADINRL